MARSTAKTVSEYLMEMPEDRKKAIQAVRKVIKKNLPKGVKEAMSWGMIGYEIPLKIHPDTHNGKPLLYAALGSQKNYMVLHAPSVYIDKKTAEWFRKKVLAAGKKLDMGGGCIRFRKVEDLSLPAVGALIGKVTVQGFIQMFVKGRGGRG
ncbi:MAG: DUF1801 domain-containing protein [Bdellovibrionales bacterium]|nr:DUF1801 domain-containing protein [Bdellovibrionales bacterium]